MRFATRLALAAILALCVVAAAKARAPYWSQVRGALSLGLPKTALEPVDRIIRGAEKDGNYAEAIRAITLKIALEAGIQGNKPEEKITRMQAAIDRAPSPMRPAMQAILADWYWQYFQQNRWRFAQRTATASAPGADFTTWDLPRLYAEIDRHLQLALAGAPQLQRVPIATFDALLPRAGAPDSYRPTLYDFVVFEALEFYGSGEQAGARPEDAFVLQANSPVFGSREEFRAWRIAAADSTSPLVRALGLYQSLLRFHATDRDSSARIDADLWRIEFAHDHAVGPERDARYAAALEREIARDSTHELSARALHSLASLRYSQGDAVGARALAERGVARFPKSVGGHRCFNLIQEIEAKSLSVSGSESVWNGSLPTIDLRYRNLRDVYFRLVPFDVEAALQTRGGYVNLWGVLRDYHPALALKPARQWHAVLRGTPDYRERSERLPVPRNLPPGSYYLIASASADFAEVENSLSMGLVWVSDLALIIRDGRPTGLEGFVLDATSGAPLANAAIRTWVPNDRRECCSPGPSASTNADGMFHLPNAAGIQYLLATRGAQRLGSTGYFRDFRPDRSGGDERTLFFTDRAIYRPGQVIQYKGLCIAVDPVANRYQTIARRHVTVVFEDWNGREIARTDDSTNGYGSFSGKFTAPTEGLRGRMTLRMQAGPAGLAFVNVEEYQRPKFLVTLDAPEIPPRLAGRAELVGHAIAYSGAPVDGANVTWRVIRGVQYPVWWTWYYREPYSSGPEQAIAHGVATTDREGRFRIAFVALPDSGIAADREPVFDYQIEADVTDGSGETRSANHRVTVGYTSLKASLSADPWQEAARPVDLKIRTTSLDGVGQACAGTLTVTRLMDPPRLTRAEDPAPDYEEDASGNLTPRTRPEAPDSNASVDAGNPATWHEGARVLTRGMVTDTSGAAAVSLRLATGMYRAKYETRDRFGVTVRAYTILRVLNPASTRCAIPVRDLFAIRRASVEPGEEFLAVWGSGYPSARAYVEVEHRGQVLQSFWTRPEQTQVAIRLHVDESMRGGFMVRVTRVAENHAYLNERCVDVPWTDHVLSLRWEHFVSKLQPGRHETWTAVIRGPRGVPAPAEMVATLYDASLDAFSWLGWSDIRGFRRNQDLRTARLEGGALYLAPVTRGWSRTGQDASLEYRALPSGLLWGDYTYGFEELLAPRRSSSFAIPGRPPAAGHGHLAGTIRRGNGGVVPYASVLVLGTKLGATTDDQGRYVIRDLPPGDVRVQVQALGFERELRVARITVGATTFLDFEVRNSGAVRQVEEITVTAEKRIDTRASTTKQNLAGLQAGDNLRQAIASNAGIVAPSGELHFRGGRPNEFQFDGVQVEDPLMAGLGAITARSDLRETAFFYPHLRSGSDGLVRIEFTIPEALTEWHFVAFAHDRRLRSGKLEARAVTSSDLMVQPNPPRFLREGDEIEFTAKITNQTDLAQDGRIRLHFTRAMDDSSEDVALRLSPDQSFSIPARASHSFSWRIRVPDGAGVLKYKVVASAGKLSDGEEGWLPVVARRVLVTESLPLPIRGPVTRRFDFEHLRRSGESTTLRHQALTVQMVSNPAWYAVMALPYLIECPYECCEQTFNRLYANALARHIANSDTAIRAVFDRWKGTPALDSPLEKNEQLKSVVISETPWLRQAMAESRARRNVGVLFDASRLDRENEAALAKLERMQNPDGMWPWFPGGPSNEYITLYITTGFGRLRHLGVQVRTDPAVRSLDRLDAWADGLYREILLRGDPASNHLSPTIALYLYGRSFFLADRPIGKLLQAAIDFWLRQAREHWLEVRDRQTRGHLALALLRFGDRATARAIMRSVREYAVTDEELGMFWRDTEYSWWWYRAPIETQALMIEAFAEVTSDSAAVEDCRVWLLKQKQTQDWKTTKATADAVYALLLRGSRLLSSHALVQVTVGDSLVHPADVEAGTGFYEKRFAPAAIAPAMGRVSVTKSDPGVAWGSVHWQYFEDMDKVQPYTGTPLKLVKTLFVRSNGKSGPELHPVEGPVHVGDELLVRVELRVDRDMEYVHLKDSRGSGTEPTNVLSRYRYQDGLAYYEETLDTASHFFIDYLPKGTYVFEYPLRVQLRGRYTSGVAEIQCMYAPEFNSHSGSTLLVVE